MKNTESQREKRGPVKKGSFSQERKRVCLYSRIFGAQKQKKRVMKRLGTDLREQKAWASLGTLRAAKARVECRSTGEETPEVKGKKKNSIEEMLGKDSFSDRRGRA